MATILAEECLIGTGTVIEPTAIFRGLNGKARRIVIGDHCYIGANVQVICDDFCIGDYSKIHHGTTVHGPSHCHIGHNAWIGQNCVIDATGGADIGHNCGIGAQSQLWSHIKYGDTLEGCRFSGSQPLQVGMDVWFVGHCIVSPIRAQDKSMALAGSVVTKDMEYNQVYAGVPASNITDKVGPQFREVSLEEKMDRMHELLSFSGVDSSAICIVPDVADYKEDRRTYFFVNSRLYTKKNTPEEIRFMKYLLPEKAKFCPYDVLTDQHFPVIPH